MNLSNESVATIATVGTAFASALIWFVRFVQPIIADKRNEAAFKEIGRLGTIGASAAAFSYFKALEAARSPTSDGGKAVTPAEQKLALKAGVDEAWATLKRQAPGIIKNVISYYGDDDKAKQSLEVIVRRKAFGERLDQQMGDAP